ncbi:hypothetical protein [Collimonas sp. PA-H2]|uniref:hypothetical protein n=1 Tax=Collimonas sp. PA-H2 TaxID=1881062 RepID=UPI00117E4ACA|nr:hypothetical protein [Collimonas sp. PA-H2]
MLHGFALIGKPKSVSLIRQENLSQAKAIYDKAWLLQPIGVAVFDKVEYLAGRLQKIWLAVNAKQTSCVSKPRYRASGCVNFSN